MSVELDISKTLVLWGLVHHPDVRKVYLKALKADQRLFGFMRSPYSTIESVLRLLYGTDDSVTPRVVMSYLVDKGNKIPPADTKFKANYFCILEVLDNSSAYTEKLALEALRQSVSKLSMQDLQYTIRDIADPAKVEEALNRFRTSTAALHGGDGSDEIMVYNPAKDKRSMLIYEACTPTGVAVIDKVLKGGIGLGKHMGILGPSGGGKTVLANQLICHLAMQGYKCLLVQFEQLIGGDISVRLFSYLTGHKVEVFRNKAFDTLPSDIKEAVDKVSHVADNVRCISFADKAPPPGQKGINYLVQVLDKVYKDFPYDFAVFDWLGAAVTGYMKVGEDRPAAYHESAEELQDVLNKHGRSHNATYIYLHQTDNPSQEREPAYKPNKNNSHQFHSFANKLEVCVQLGTATKYPEEGYYVAWLIAGKNRTEASGHAVIVKMYGEYMRMEETSKGEYMIDTKGQFKKTSDMLKITAAPTEASSKASKDEVETFRSFLSGY